jgi:hypothetical protein
MDIFLRETCPLRRNMGCGNHPQGNGLTVEKCPVSSNRFNRVAEGVPKVQQGAAPGGFPFVFRDKRTFDFNASLD